MAGTDMRERFTGCLFGCAVGDALGAPFEGLWSHAIPSEAELLSGFAEFEGYPRGQYTDDTQLTLATVRSILATGGVAPPHIARSIAVLFKRQEVIGPGGACLYAAEHFLRNRDWRTCGAEQGQAGNGTAMRTAAVGLAFLHCPDRLPEAVADVSRVTHHDSRSIAGGVAVAKMAQLLATAPEDDPASFCPILADTIAPYSSEFASWIERLPALCREPARDAVRSIAWAGMPEPEFEVPIITPFVIPTVLAAFWCLLRQPDSWPGAVASAIRLGGDVDTLGAIVGALMGIRLGLEAVPENLRGAVPRAGQLETLARRYHEWVSRTGATGIG